MPSSDIGLYLHIPYCAHKCAYCNFASGTFNTLSQESYIDALIKEVKSRQELKEHTVKTIFIGGGTPSYLDTAVLEKLLKALKPHTHHLSEWTIENNPNSISEDKLKLYQDHGVTRLSLGVQSFDPQELKFLERVHSVDEAHRALDLAEKMFPSRWNADLIYALPEQKISTWLSSVKELLKHQPQHLSMYELTYENETPLGQQLKRGDITVQEDEDILAFQEEAKSLLSDQGLKRYEVSNYAVPGHECVHNLEIWKGMEFIGCGNGAHGRYQWTQTRNVASPVEYVERLKKGKSPRIEENFDDSVHEKLMTLLILGLRSKEGVCEKNLREVANATAAEIWPTFPKTIENAVYIHEGALKCREHAWNVLDSIVIELLNCFSDFSILN